MDTTEEAKGTYWYHGHSNVTPGELFDLIFIEQLADSLGVTTEAVTLMLIGQPLFLSRVSYQQLRTRLVPVSHQYYVENY